MRFQKIRTVDWKMLSGDRFSDIDLAMQSWRHTAIRRHVQVWTKQQRSPRLMLGRRGKCWGKYSDRALSDSRTVPYCAGVERGGFSHQSKAQSCRLAQSEAGGRVESSTRLGNATNAMQGHRRRWPNYPGHHACWAFGAQNLAATVLDGAAAGRDGFSARCQLPAPAPNRRS
jgi:hypothetical protein